MAGKIVIPNQLKQDLPQNIWGKILGVTPIVMTVIATMLAGLASSEMTRAQYARAYAAQLQAKAGDQWNYYQAKKLRSVVARNNLDLLAATSEVTPLSASALPDADPATLAALTENRLPEATPARIPEEVQKAVDLVVDSRPETEIAAVLAPIPSATLDTALREAQDAVKAFDNASKSVNKAVDKYDETLMTGDKSLFRGFSAARLRYATARYETESRLNLTVAALLELQVRNSNYLAEKHQQRSGKFFKGMLGAQMAVIISTFAIAARKRNILWGMATAAGAIAVAFSLYVYLCV